MRGVAECEDAGLRSSHRVPLATLRLAELLENRRPDKRLDRRGLCLVVAVEQVYADDERRIHFRQVVHIRVEAVDRPGVTARASTRRDALTVVRMRALERLGV